VFSYDGSVGIHTPLIGCVPAPHAETVPCPAFPPHEAENQAGVFRSSSRKNLRHRQGQDERTRIPHRQQAYGIPLKLVKGSCRAKASRRCAGQPSRLLAW